MERASAEGRRDSELRRVRGVVAVKVGRDPETGAPAARSRDFTSNPSAGQVSAGRIGSDGLGFARGGWVFVRPSPATRRASCDRNALPPSASAMGAVYSTAAGRLKVSTSRLVLRLRRAPASDLALKARLAALGLELVRRLSFSRGLLEVRVQPGRAAVDEAVRLSAEAGVLHAEPVMREHLAGREFASDPELARQWQWRVPGVDAESAWKATRGGGVTIGVVDTAFDLDHDDLAPALTPGCAYFDADGALRRTRVGFPSANAGHGTFCAGMAAARDGNGGGCGAAPRAGLTLVACHRDQIGDQLTLARAIAYAAEPDTEAPGEGIRGCDVITCSLGSDGAVWDLTAALREAIAFAAAKGRSGRGCPVFWAASNVEADIILDEVCSHPDVTAVGRSRPSDTEDNSASGPKLDFLAPGVDVVSTLPGGSYGVRSGTSFAAPCAAGVAALVLATKPTLTRREVIDVLRRTCDRIGPLPYDGGRNDDCGFGRINAAKAVAAAAALPG